MKKVDFYLISNQVADAKYKLSSRLANKLQRLKQKTLIVTDDETASRKLDELMWSFSDTSFVAHENIKHNDLHLSNIHIGEFSQINSAHLDNNYDVLINLSTKVPEFTHHFSRIAEIVEQNDDSKTQARLRFRRYKEEGFELDTHQIEL